MSDTEQIRQLLTEWADAEQRGDDAALGAMTTDDFTLVGPAGFVLTKRQWAGRYALGDLVTSSLVLEEVAVREYGDTAVTIGRHTQQATYQGHPADGQFRVTHVLVRQGDDWKIAGMHLSPIGGPPPFPAARQ